LQINNPMVQYRVYGVYIMRELNVNEIEQVNGGIVTEAGYLEDALVIGGAVLAGGATAAITSPLWVIAGAVTASYYAGKFIGSFISGTSRNFHTKYSPK